MSKNVSRLAAAFIFIICGSPFAGPLSIEDAFKPSLLLSMQISPDGRQLAGIAQTKDKAAVVIFDADTMVGKVVYPQEPGLQTPFSVRWVNNEKLAVNLYRDLLIMDPTGKKIKTLWGRYWRNVTPDAQGHLRILTGSSASRGQIYRVDTETWKDTLMNWEIPGRGDTTRWVLDEDGVPLVVTTVDTTFLTKETTITHWYRQSIDSKWEKLGEFPFLDVPWYPYALSRDRQTLYVISDSGRDTTAVFSYSLAERRLGELQAGHPTQDLANLTRSETEEGYLRVVTSGMKPEIYWFDERWAGLQLTVDLALPGRINWLSGNPEGRVLVRSYADVDPGRWYVLDTKAKQLNEVGESKPHIKPEEMLPKRIVRYVAPDGVSIPAYLTLPKNAEKNLPAVVLVHGGPVLRDYWNWDPEVQMLASRGYAVLQPQFRGSEGFGKKFVQLGYKQWGLAMQDDITAGAQWLASEGIADPKRMCIYGGSYGGYAAMWALAKTPDLFRCGISFAGVSDLTYMFRDSSDNNDYAASREYMRMLVGDPDASRQQFDEVSPLKNAARIKSPIFIAHGNRDGRVPIDHSEKMIDALKENGKQYEWMELNREGHGIGNDENRLKFYNALFKFLDRNIGEGSKAK